MNGRGGNGPSRRKTGKITSSPTGTGSNRRWAKKCSGTLGGSLGDVWAAGLIKTALKRHDKLRGGRG